MTKRTNVLLLHQNGIDADAISRELTASGLKVEVASPDSRESFKTVLADIKPDAVLSEYSPDRFSACEVIDVLRYESPETPVIVVSMLDENDLKRIPHDVQGFLTKPVGAGELLGALERAGLPMRAVKVER